MSEVILPFGAGKVPFCRQCKTPLPQQGRWVMFADSSFEESTTLFCHKCYVTELADLAAGGSVSQLLVLLGAALDDDGAP